MAKSGAPSQDLGSWSTSYTVSQVEATRRRFQGQTGGLLLLFCTTNLRERREKGVIGGFYDGNFIWIPKRYFDRRGLGFTKGTMGFRYPLGQTPFLITRVKDSVDIAPAVVRRSAVIQSNGDTEKQFLRCKQSLWGPLRVKDIHQSILHLQHMLKPKVVQGRKAGRTRRLASIACLIKDGMTAYLSLGPCSRS